MKEKDVKFSKHSLAGVFHSPRKSTSTCIITCHGLCSNKDSEKYVNIAQRFCREGLSILRFDFRGCGESGGLFENTSITGRMEDFKDALDFVQEQGYDNTGIVGSSLGGTVGVLTAAKDRRVRALAIWATPCHLSELFQGEAFNGLVRLREDVSNHNVAKAIKEVHCPILITHGSLDEQVPLSHAKTLYKNANKPKSVRVIEGADHRFACIIHRRKAVELTVNWFKKYLK